jgi:predicted type IV restriction endonuclease
MSKTIISLILSVLAALFAALGWDIDLPSIEIIAEGGVTVFTILHYALLLGAGVFRVLAKKQTNAVGVYTDKPLG